jgi:hypothetical protein
MGFLKYIVFFGVIIVGVPVGFAFAKENKYVERVILFLAIFFTCQTQSINFISREFYKGTSKGFEITLVDVVVIILFLLIIHRKDINKIYLFPPGTILYFLYFSISCISILNAAEPLYSFFEVQKLARVYIYYWVLYNYIRDEKQLKSIVFDMSLVMAFIFWEVFKEKYINHGHQCSGPFSHQNAMCMYSEFFGCVIFAAVLNQKSKKGSFLKTLFLLVTFGMSAICVLFSLSRGGLVAFGLALGIIFFVSYTTRLTVKKMTITLLFLIIGSLVMLKAWSTIHKRFTKAPKNSANTRVLLAIAAQKMADDKFFGIGLNNFGIKILPPYPYGDHIEKTASNSDGAVVETTYLLIASETGWVNLGVYLAFLMLFYWKNLLNSFRYRKSELNFLPFAFLGGLTAVYLQSTLEWVLRQTNNSYQLMIIFAIIGVMSRMHKNKKKQLKQLKAQ